MPFSRKLFEGKVLRLVDEWITDTPATRHAETLDFEGWWHIIMEGHYGIVTAVDCKPDFEVVMQQGVPYLKAPQMRINVFDFTTYMFTSLDHSSTNSCSEMSQ